jgi:hypothetical protein
MSFTSASLAYQLGLSNLQPRHPSILPNPSFHHQDFSQRLLHHMQGQLSGQEWDMIKHAGRSQIDMLLSDAARR